MTVTINGTTGVSLCAASSVPSTALQSGVPSRSQLPAGTVLQVVNAQDTTRVLSSTQTPAATNIAATITPTSATSKILVLGNVSVGKDGANTNILLFLYRNGSQILSWDRISGFTGSTGATYCMSGVNYLDSPASTSSQTYTVYFGNGTGTGTTYINDIGYGSTPTTSTITLMEIAA